MEMIRRLDYGLEKILWRWGNKKPPTPNEVYSRLNYTGTVTGLIIGLGVGTSLQYLETDWRLSAFSMVLFVLGGIFVYIRLKKGDKKRGFFDIGQKDYIEYWHQRNKYFGYE